MWLTDRCFQWSCTNVPPVPPDPSSWRWKAEESKRCSWQWPRLMVRVDPGPCVCMQDGESRQHKCSETPAEEGAAAWGCRGHAEVSSSHAAWFCTPQTQDLIKNVTTCYLALNCIMFHPVCLYFASTCMSALRMEKTKLQLMCHLGDAAARLLKRNELCTSLTCRAHRYKWHRSYSITVNLEPKHDRKWALLVGSRWNQSSWLHLCVGVMEERLNPLCVIHSSNNSFGNGNEMRVQQEGRLQCLDFAWLTFWSSGSELEKVLFVLWQSLGEFLVLIKMCNLGLLAMSGRFTDRSWTSDMNYKISKEVVSSMQLLMGWDKICVGYKRIAVWNVHVLGSCVIVTF